MYKLYHDNCFNILPDIQEHSVNLVCVDPPYGTTSIDWDKTLDFKIIWKELSRIVKPKGMILIFGSQPFTSQVITSNLSWFKYELIWNKNKSGSPGLAKIRPLKVHENIMVFSRESGGTYNPIIEKGVPFKRESKNPEGYGTGVNTHGYGFGKNKVLGFENTGTRYPKSILHASRNFSAQQTVHPTQKPTNLLNWLIMTYSNPEETVLDFTMGSGSCGVSAIMTGRNFIGIEIDKEYFDIATTRIDETVEKTKGKLVPLVSEKDHQLTTQISKDMKTT